MKSSANLKLKFLLRRLLYLSVLYGLSIANAGSFDDFFTAIKRDDAVTVTHLIRRGFDPNTLDPAGNHGLLLALQVSSLNVVTALLKAPQIKVEVRNAQDESPLMLAAFQGLTTICKKLIDADADVNKPGWTPLHYAATHGHVEVINLLLSHYAYIDAASPNGTTPLMMAAEYGTTAAVNLLLESGADVELKNELGLSALDFAQRAQRPDAIKIISAFIRDRQPKGTW